MGIPRATRRWLLCAALAAGPAAGILRWHQEAKSADVAQKAEWHPHEVDHHGVTLPPYPNEEELGNIDWPCNHSDVWYMHGRFFWDSIKTCKVESYQPMARHFNGGHFADCTFQKEPRVQHKCLNCIGQGIWGAIMKSCYDCMLDICHPKCFKCAGSNYSIVDVCAGALRHHTDMCQHRLDEDVIDHVTNDEDGWYKELHDEFDHELFEEEDQEKEDNYTKEHNMSHVMPAPPDFHPESVSDHDNAPSFPDDWSEEDFAPQTR